MASSHTSSRFNTFRPSSSLPSSQRRTVLRIQSGQSTTLRSAEEQLRNLREGDTSWQRLYKPESPSSCPPSLSSIVGINGNDGAKNERTVRVFLHVAKTDTMPLILLVYEISAPVL